MAWITIRLDDTLVQAVPDEQGQEQFQPMDGALEAVQLLISEGHRITITTERFKPMPDDRKEILRQHLQEQLGACGFPPNLEIWNQSNIPAADIDIGTTNVTFDNDWGLALAQTEQMMLDRGLIPPGAGAASLDQTESQGMDQEQQEPQEEQTEPLPQEQ